MSKMNKADAGAVEREIISRTSSDIKPLPMLEVIFSGIPTDLTSAMKSSLGLLSEVVGTEIAYTTWGAVTSGMGKHDICAVSSADAWKGSLMIVIDPKLFYTILETQMNGSPDTAIVPERTVSTIERRVAKRFCQVFLDQLSSNFNRAASVNFSVDSIESTQQVSSTQGVNSPCVVATTTMRIGKFSGSIKTVIPISTLSPVYDTLSTMFLGENFEADGTWRDMLSRRIGGSCVEIQAVLDTIRVPVAQIMRWQPGDVLHLDVGPNDEMSVTCAGMSILKAQRGHKKNRVAMRITRDYADDPLDGSMESSDMREHCEKRL